MTEQVHAGPMQIIADVIWIRIHFPGDLGEPVQCRSRSWRGLVYPRCLELHGAFALIARNSSG